MLCTVCSLLQWEVVETYDTAMLLGKWDRTIVELCPWNDCKIKFHFPESWYYRTTHQSLFYDPKSATTKLK
jgi:hypothetical protein